MQRELSHHAGPVFSSRSSQFWSILKWRRGRWLRPIRSLDRPGRLSSAPRFRLKTFCLEDRRASERLHVAAWNMWQHFPHTGWSCGGGVLVTVNHLPVKGYLQWTSGKWHSGNVESFSTVPEREWLEWEQATPLSEENGRHCGSKGQLSGFHLTQRRSNQTKTGTKPPYWGGHH